MKKLLQGVRDLYRLRELVSPAIREVFFLLGLWRPANQPHAIAAQRFAEVNRKFWEPAPNGKQQMLIEGHLAEYGPNYLFRTGLAAKAVQSVIGGIRVVVVFNGFSYCWQLACHGYRSFGITDWIFLGRKFVLLAPMLTLIANVRAAWFFFNVHTPQQLLDLHFGGIRVGDLVYDEILRETNLPTISSIGWAVYKVIARSCYYYLQYHLLFTLGRYSCYVATHTAYPEYGLLCRVALQRGVMVIETSDIQMSTYDSIGERDLPTYHQGINAEIRMELRSGTDSRESRHVRARVSLLRRLDSEVRQIDAQKAYSGKIYSRQSLLKTFGISEPCKVGFVAAHVFRDSPHLSSSMLHADYYRWLEETIAQCSESPNMIWVVKPHPSCALYGEEGMVEALVKERGGQSVFVCPKDLNTSSLRDCADVILTVHGTVGLEYACLGIPPIIAGTPFYAGFGFTHEPKSIDEYNGMVRRAASLERLSDGQTSMALQVFAVWEQQFDWNNPIVTSAVLAQVWGNGTPRDVAKAYELLTQNLAQHDPRELKLWRFARAVASRDVAKSAGST